MGPVQAPLNSNRNLHGAQRLIKLFLEDWIARPILFAILLFIAVAILSHLVMCLVDGFIWSTMIADDYGFLVIRIVVVLALSIYNIIAFPFRHSPQFLSMLASSATLCIPFGLLAQLTLTPKAINETGAFGGCVQGLVYILAAVPQLAYAVHLVVESQPPTFLTFVMNPIWVGILIFAVFLLVINNLVLDIMYR